jgi:HEPN domain-containing protein
LTNITLAQSYLTKARKRIKILPVLLEESAYSDVIREAQEIVEFALKRVLRKIGIEPPKWHDVGGLLLEYAERLPGIPVEDLQRLASISHWLRKEREFSFYGDVDFIPTEQYTREDALRAEDDAQFVVETLSHIILLPNESS